MLGLLLSCSGKKRSAPTCFLSGRIFRQLWDAGLISGCDLSVRFYSLVARLCLTHLAPHGLWPTRLSVMDFPELCKRPLRWAAHFPFSGIFPYTGSRPTGFCIWTGLLSWAPDTRKLSLYEGMSKCQGRKQSNI